MQNQQGNESFIDQYKCYLDAGDLTGCLAVLQELQPFDMAALFVSLEPTQQPQLLRMLDTELLADMMQELSPHAQYDAFRLLGRNRTTEVMDRMDNDDLALFLDALSEEDRNRFLANMDAEESENVQRLMNYPPETAGRIMTNRYVWIPLYYSVKEAVEKIREFAEISETLSYLYVIDEMKKLIGVVSYRDLILADASDKIADIMYTRVISVTVDTDQEEVADIMRRYDFLALPVVDEAQILSGIVTVDDIMDVIVHEANEDIHKLSGGAKGIDFDTKPGTAAVRRLPWLILLLFIGLVSGTIISRFEDTLNQIVALAFFMPMIAGMTGNTGTQSLAVVVRGLISREMDKKEMFKLVKREFTVGLLIGLTCGVLVTIIAYVWQGSITLGLVVGASLLVTLILGTLAGTVIPLLLNKLKIDPAIASGPLITTLNDVLSLLIYFGIATAFLSYLL
ncbi:magnesium transporter [Paenibacillus tarimensis]|uniref:magnesium transporter n=1 Tax=Paenibacillus tarimensis TaxID=416012 RepID=UPI001F44F42A|nr:magnesium transporter [Paenibacillus tarimensis]MCF2942739.1 magnesium transporter [Paenibacillus tarimensis]